MYFFYIKKSIRTQKRFFILLILLSFPKIIYLLLNGGEILIFEKL